MLKHLRRAALRRDVTDEPEADTRVEFLLDDGSALNVVRPLELDGRLLMLEAEVEVEPGVDVRFIPMVDGDANLDLFEFRASVHQSWIDVLVSAYATNRYLMSVELPDDRELLASVGQLLAPSRAPARRAGNRRQVDSHRPELLASAFWATPA